MLQRIQSVDQLECARRGVENLRSSHSITLSFLVPRAMTIPSRSNKKASLEESVGEVGFRERAEIVIERGLVGFLGTKSVGFSGDQF